MAKKIGFLLFNGPYSQDVGTVAGLAGAALKRGLEVEIFVMYEAVLNSVNDKLTKLADDGAKIIVCGHNADELGAERTDKFTYAGQYENAILLNEADKYIAFT